MFSPKVHAVSGGSQLYVRVTHSFTLGMANAHLGANTLSLPNELTMKHEDSRHFLAIIPPEILLSAAVVE